MVVFQACGELACAGATEHGLGIFGHFGKAVMSAFTAVCKAGVRICTFVITIRFVVLALCAAYAAGADQVGIACGARSAAACVRILNTFARCGIDVEAVDAL